MNCVSIRTPGFLVRWGLKTIRNLTLWGRVGTDNSIDWFENPLPLVSGLFDSIECKVVLIPLSLSRPRVSRWALLCIALESIWRSTPVPPPVQRSHRFPVVFSCSMRVHLTPPYSDNFSPSFTSPSSFDGKKWHPGVPPKTDTFYEWPRRPGLYSSLYVTEAFSYGHFFSSMILKLR